MAFWRAGNLIFSNVHCQKSKYVEWWVLTGGVFEENKCKKSYGCGALLYIPSNNWKCIKVCIQWNHSLIKGYIEISECYTQWGIHGNQIEGTYCKMYLPIQMLLFLVLFLLIPLHFSPFLYIISLYLSLPLSLPLSLRLSHSLAL